MASGLSSPTGVAGVLLVVIGLIMAVVGVIFLIAGQSGNWWTWLLFIGGIVLIIIGAILIAVALASTPAVAVCDSQPMQRVVYATPAPAPVATYVAPAPAPQVVYAPTPAPAPQIVYAPAPTPAPAAVPVVAPPPQVTTHSYQIGQEHFDPDPIARQSTSTVIAPPTPRRTTVIGPYGPGGQNIEISGVYTPPAVATQTTTTSQYDIVNHPVVSVPPGQLPAPVAAPAAVPQQFVVRQAAVAPAVPQQQFVAAPGFTQIPAGTYQVQRTAPAATVTVQQPVRVATF